jgi:hypothetical protein
MCRRGRYSVAGGALGELSVTVPRMRRERSAVGRLCTVLSPDSLGRRRFKRHTFKGLSECRVVCLLREAAGVGGG